MHKVQFFQPNADTRPQRALCMRAFIQIDAAPHVFGEGMLVRQRLAAAAGPVFHICIAESQEIQRHALESVAQQVFAGNQSGRQHIGLEVDRATVAHARIEGLGQASKVDGRLVPVAVLPAFEAVEDIRLGNVNYRLEPYASNDAVPSRLEQNRRNAAALATTLVQNEHSQQFSIAEMAEKTTANKAIQRGD